MLGDWLGDKLELCDAEGDAALILGLVDGLAADALGLWLGDGLGDADGDAALILGLADGLAADTLGLWDGLAALTLGLCDAEGEAALILGL